MSTRERLQELRKSLGEVKSQVGEASPEEREQLSSLIERGGSVVEKLRDRDPAELIEDQPNQLKPGIVDSNDTDAFQSAKQIMDTTPDTMLAKREAETIRRLEEDRQKRDELRSERRGLVEKQADAMGDVDMEGLVREERKRLEVPEALDAQRASIEEMRGIRQQITELENQKAEALATSEGRQAPMGFIRGEQERIQEQFNRREATLSKRLQAENAHLQAMQGQVSQARSLINDVVNAATYDTEMELKRIQSFREVNEQEISELDQDIQRQLQESQQYWQTQLETERQEKQQVMELMINTPRAGINVDDTLEEAAEKARAAGAVIPEAAQTTFEVARNFVAQNPDATPADVRQHVQQVTGETITRGDAQDIIDSPRPDPVGGEVPTFDEFLQQAQEQAAMSFSPQMIEDLREAYNQEIQELGVTPRATGRESLSPQAQQVLDNPAILEQFGQKRTDEIQDELAEAGLSIPVLDRAATPGVSNRFRIDE